MAPSVLVTGAPRSGTGYLAAVLRTAGIDAGHEAWWGIEPQRQVSVDVSWLGCFDNGFDGRVFAQVRNPLTAIPSIAAAYDKHPWRLVLAQNVALTGDRAVDACWIWLTYTERATSRAESWWRVEDIDAFDLQWTGVDCPEAIASTPRDVNTRPGINSEWPDHPVVDDCLELARGLGYMLEDPR